MSREDRRPATRLVLVHGSRLSASQWAPQQSRVAADPTLGWLEVVVPDLPGHGPRSAEPFTLDRAVGAVAAAVEAGVPAERVVLAGHSLGGYVAATYAATYPGRLDGLVILGAAARPRGAGAAAYRGVALLTERAGPDRMTRVNDRVLGRLYPADLVEPVVAGGYWFGPTRTAWREVMARCGPHQLREVSCPVLVAGGVYDQLMLDARRYARAAPHGRMVRIPGAGHLAGFDRPDEVTALLVDFVRGVADGTLEPP
ncbi:MAG TPA: alpha/beta hydrolase [Lapillicoccus sp.]|uniref:alpha/beta fold hydrolase n=1 Tax=Lapillicoccus sp. TaxID=1909287 RepID=UPI002F954CD7